jgi:hypothetical protein
MICTNIKLLRERGHGLLYKETNKMQLFVCIYSKIRTTLQYQKGDTVELRNSD